MPPRLYRAYGSQVSCLLVVALLAISAYDVPPHLYRAYGSQVSGSHYQCHVYLLRRTQRGSTHDGCAHYHSQFAATRAVLLQRPRAYYERLLLWLITPHDSMHTKGDLAPSLSPPLSSNPHPSPQP